VKPAAEWKGIQLREEGSGKMSKHDESKDGFFERIGDFVSDLGSSISSVVSFGKPDADVKGIHIPHLSTSEADLVVDVQISNPNPVPIPLCDIEYVIETNGQKLVAGTIPDAGTIHSHGSEIVKIPLHINFKEIIETFDDINPGQIVR
jgi:LEA14-like dessication related protein